MSTPLPNDAPQRNPQVTGGPTVYGDISAPAAPRSATVGVQLDACAAALERLARSGFQSSEFWLCLIVVAMLAVAAWGNRVSGEFATSAATVLVIAYKLLRGSIKDTNGDQIVSIADIIAADPRAAVAEAEARKSEAALQILRELSAGAAAAGASAPPAPTRVESTAPAPAAPASPEAASMPSLTTMALGLLLAFGLGGVAALLGGCATDTGVASKDRAGRVTNAVLVDLFNTTAQAAITYGAGAMQGQNGQDFAAAAFESATLRNGIDNFSRIADAYAGPHTAPVVGTALAQIATIHPETLSDQRLVLNTVGAALQSVANQQAL